MIESMKQRQVHAFEIQKGFYGAVQRTIQLLHES
jgi:hypothetical protein